MKTKSNKQNEAATVNCDKPGRPRYNMVCPDLAAFTFTELMEANGVDTQKYLKNGKVNKGYAKGVNCSMLTCRKNLKYQLATGEVCLMKGYTAVPVSNDGQSLGRRGLLYRSSKTPFATALAMAKVRGAEGLNENPAPAPKVKTVPVVPKAHKVKTVKTNKVTGKAAAKAAVEKMVAAAHAILEEPIATVQITPAPAPVAPVNPVAPVAEPAPVVETVAVAPVADETKTPESTPVAV